MAGIETVMNLTQKTVDERCGDKPAKLDMLDSFVTHDLKWSRKPWSALRSALATRSALLFIILKY